MPNAFCASLETLLGWRGRWASSLRANAIQKSWGFCEIYLMFPRNLEVADRMNDIRYLDEGLLASEQCPRRQERRRMHSHTLRPTVGQSVSHRP
jgi:hypothetical protein